MCMSSECSPKMRDGWSHNITQQPEPPSLFLPLLLPLLPLLASSSSSNSAGLTDMWTTFGASALKRYS